MALACSASRGYAAAMTLETSALGFAAICLTAVALYAMATGRLRDTTRRGDPPIYWLGLSLLVAVAALHWWMLARWLGGDETARPVSALLFAPLLFFLVVKWLRSGEIVFGNNRFPRRGRAQPYWTILLIAFVAFAFYAAIIVHHATGGAA